MVGITSNRKHISENASPQKEPRQWPELETIETRIRKIFIATHGHSISMTNLSEMRTDVVLAGLGDPTADLEALIRERVCAVNITTRNGKAPKK